MASRSNHVLTDHDEIRRWAEERNASPACVRGTGGGNDVGMLRLDFPGYSGARSLEHIDWDEWFNQFDERGLALLVQDSTARGERSNFNKLVSRETARASEGGGRKRTRARAKTTARKRTARRTTAKTASRAKRKSTARRSSRSSAASTRRTSTARKTRSAGTSRTRSTRAKTSARATSSRSGSRKTARHTSASTRSSGRSSRNKIRSIESGRGSAKSHVLIDHDEIRRWATARNAAPACVRGTGGGKDPGMIRLDFPGFSGARSLEHIDWDEWFRAFDENKLALLVQETRAGGGRSNFNKLIARETAAHRARGENKWSRRHPEKASGRRTTASKKATRGSTRAHRTESVRGRSTSQRRAA